MRLGWPAPRMPRATHAPRHACSTPSISPMPAPPMTSSLTAIIHVRDHVHRLNMDVEHPRVGVLDNPPPARRRREHGVYENADGFYFKVDGRRVKVCRDQQWTTTSNVKMCGSAPLVPSVDEVIDLQAPRDAEAADGPSRKCCICLTYTPVMLMRPCNHLCACHACSNRLVRQPCPLCRRIVTNVERVYF